MALCEDRKDLKRWTPVIFNGKEIMYRVDENGNWVLFQSVARKDNDELNEVIAYILLLQNESFEGWDQDSVNGYKTALISVTEKITEIMKRRIDGE